MAETPPDNCKKENGQTCYFLRIIVVIALITIAVYYFFFINYSKNQEDIVALHEQYYDNIEKTIASGITIKDSCYYINDLVLSQMKEEQNNLKALLELQYSKQQADMTVLSTWAAVLTIVFLIFSIYAMFKLDDIMKQGRDMLTEVKDTHEKAKQRLANVEIALTEANNKIEEKTNEELQKLSEEITNRSQDFNATVNTKSNEFQDAYQKYSNEIRNIAGRIDALSEMLRNASDLSSESKETEVAIESEETT